MKRCFTCLAVLCFFGATSAFASLVDEGLVNFSGTGIGTVSTILTVQSPGNSTTEAGCVGWNGTANVIGSCNGFTGGDELKGASQTQTQPVSAATPVPGFTESVSSFSNLGLVVNADQPAGSPVNLTNLILTAYSPSGTVVGTAKVDCPAAGCVLSPTAQGIGKAGYVFQINPDQITSTNFASTTFSATDRIGVAASFANATGGPETIFLVSGSSLNAGGGGGIAGAGGGQVPEPSSILLIAGGLLCLAGLKRRSSAVKTLG